MKKYLTFLAIRKVQSGGVTVSKRPLGYSDLEHWNRTITCYSGIIAYRFMFLDVVSTHLRMKYEFQDKSQILIEKNVDLNTTSLSNNQMFNLKSTLLKNKVNKPTLMSGFLSTDFYADVKERKNGTRFISNFDDSNDHLFWTILEAESVHLMYKRQPIRYSDWDQLLGPITLTKFDKLQFQFRCLQGKINYLLKFYFKNFNFFD